MIDRRKFFLLVNSGKPNPYATLLKSAEAKGYSLPSEANQLRDQTIINNLIETGIWNKLDYLHMFNNDAGGDFERLNWKDPSYGEMQGFSYDTAGGGYEQPGSPTYLINDGFNNADSYQDGMTYFQAKDMVMPNVMSGYPFTEVSQNAYSVGVKYTGMAGIYTTSSWHRWSTALDDLEPSYHRFDLKRVYKSGGLRGYLDDAAGTAPMTTDGTYAITDDGVGYASGVTKVFFNGLLHGSCLSPNGVIEPTHIGRLTYFRMGDRALMGTLKNGWGGAYMTDAEIVILESILDGTY